MRIISGSQPSTGDLFLHIGYISANPRSFYPHGGELAQAKVIDLEADLALANPSTTVAVTPTQVYGRDSNWGNWLSTRPESLLMGWATVFFVVLGLGFRYRGPEQREPGTPPTPSAFRGTLWAALLLSLSLVFPQGGPTTAIDQGNLLPHPQRLPVQAYRDPARATEALVHAILGDAISQYRHHLYSLSSLQQQICLPVRPQELPAGAVYALQNYSLDGWGTPFRLDAGTVEAVALRSAGPDKAFDTDDDLVYRFGRPNPTGEWEGRVRGLFLVNREAQGAGLFVRRALDGMFEFRDREGALSRTGTNLFDLVLAGQEVGEVFRSGSGSGKAIGHPPLSYLLFAEPQPWGGRP